MYCINIIITHTLTHTRDPTFTHSLSLSHTHTHTHTHTTDWRNGRDEAAHGAAWPAARHCVFAGDFHGRPAAEEES
jgi:hypothetical protein